MPSSSVVETLLMAHIEKGEDAVWGNPHFRKVSGWKWPELLPDPEELPARSILRDSRRYAAVEEYIVKLDNVVKGE
jgi:hypothetical protein